MAPKTSAGHAWEDLRPILATLIDEPFDDPAWVFETKWDGFRMIAEMQNGSVMLYSRNGKILSERYLLVAQALETISLDCVINGELVALDAHGRSRFQLLQNALRQKSNLRYCVFDCLFAGGKDVRELSLLERKKILQKLLPRSGLVQLSAHRPEYGKQYFKEAKKEGQEGIIAKRVDSTYQSGVRSRDWLKIKAVFEQEVVIVGYTEPRRSREYFGSLALAVRDGGKWKYVGHVGTGFDTPTLRDLYKKLSPLKVRSPSGKRPNMIRRQPGSNRST